VFKIFHSNSETSKDINAIVKKTEYLQYYFMAVPTAIVLVFPFVTPFFGSTSVKYWYITLALFVYERLIPITKIKFISAIKLRDLITYKGDDFISL